MTGIPCHALCVIMDKSLNLEDYVSKWYRKEYFEKAYSWCIEPVYSPKYWPRTRLGAIEPPKVQKVFKRPKKIKIKED